MSHKQADRRAMWDQGDPLGRDCRGTVMITLEFGSNKCQTVSGSPVDTQESGLFADSGDVW